MAYRQPYGLPTAPLSPTKSALASTKSKVKQMKWLPKTPTGDPENTYSRAQLLHCLHLGVAKSGSASTKEGENDNVNDVNTLVPKLKTASREECESRMRKNSSDNKAWADFEPKYAYNDGETKGTYDDSWCSTQVYSGVDSPELGCQPSDLSDYAEYWDMYPEQYEQEEYVWPITSLVMLNIPTKYKPLELVKDIQSHDFGKELNFLYLPRDPNKTDLNWGTCTVNFASEERAQEFFDYFNGSKCSKVLKKHNSTRMVKVFPARMQGIEWNLEELRRDPVLEKLEEESKWRPLLFEDEKPMPFLVGRRARNSTGDAETSSRKARNPSEAVNPEVHTTIMMRNIPNKYTRAMLHDRLQTLFDPLDYDFIYMPIDFINKCNVGYAFLNFRTKAAVQKAIDVFHNVECQQALPGFNSQKIVELTPARVQGLDNNIEHLQNSEVLSYMRDHNDWTPLVFDDKGNAMPFPISDSSVYFNTKRRDSGGKGSRGKKRALSGTTIVVSNVPTECTREKFIELLDSIGLKGEYDFLYFPFDPVTEIHEETAYINFRHAPAASKFSVHVSGKTSNEVFPNGFLGAAEDTQIYRIDTPATMEVSNSVAKTLSVSPAPLQGLDKNIASVKEKLSVLRLKDYSESCPLIFDVNGGRLSFPESSLLRPDAPTFSPQLRPEAAPFVPNDGILNSPTLKLQAVREMMEHVFSDSNLARDVFLRSHMDADGWVNTHNFLRFPGLVTLAATTDLIAKSVANSKAIEIKSSGTSTTVRIKDKKLRDKWLLKGIAK